MMNSFMEIINTKDTEPEYILSDSSVELVVYPRVHMFTFDLSLISGILKHGSLGYSLKNMPIKIIVRKAIKTKEDRVFSKSGYLQVENLDFKVDFQKLREYIKSEDHYIVEIESGEYAREHTGLGTSTQILGGIYLCCAKLSGVSIKINDLFNLGIGHYSALGLNLLFNPGMIFEMGVKPSDKKKGLIINPTLSKKHETVANTVIKVNDFPFYTIVAIPKEADSISGEYEVDFWNQSLPDKNEDSYKIIYNVFERIIPGIVELDFNTFIYAIDENIKLGSKPLEEKIQSAQTKLVLEDFRREFGFAAISSLGPALYSFSEKDPSDVLKKINTEDYTIFVYEQNGNIKRKINNDETLLIASFACMGKTTYAKNYPSIALDIESIHYARQYSNKHPNDEVAKSDDNWTSNPNYPANYVREVSDNIGKYKVIFLTGGKDILSGLDELNIKYSILYPGPNRKSQVLIDAKNRGNDENFVELLDNLLSSDRHRKSFEDLNYERFEIIDDDKYMEEYIKENYIV